MTSAGRPRPAHGGHPSDAAEPPGPANPANPADPTALEAPTPEALRELGRRLAGLLTGGDLVLLIGPLGAGKTTLAQGIGAGLGVPGPVTSPTFVLARVHRGGRLPLVHVDAYRLGSAAELDDLDLDASVEDSVTVVEWGEGMAEGLAFDRLEVRLELPAAELSGRLVRITAVGTRWAGRDLGAVIAGVPGR